MTPKWKHLLGGAALFTMALPVWAHTDAVRYVAVQPAMVEGHKLAPGTYTLDASDTTNQVEVKKNGNVIATVPCKWIQLPQKANHSEVLSDKARLTELKFAGKTEAVRFTAG
jgi:hypothetical protein